MIVDCDRCAARGRACQDCVITVLLGAPPGGVDLDGAERYALDTLADAGMVPRLQLVDRQEAQCACATGSAIGVHQRDRAERSATYGKRSRRHVS